MNSFSRGVLLAGCAAVLGVAHVAVAQEAQQRSVLAESVPGAPLQPTARVIRLQRTPSQPASQVAQAPANQPAPTALTAAPTPRAPTRVAQTPAAATPTLTTAAASPGPTVKQAPTQVAAAARPAAPVQAPQRMAQTTSAPAPARATAPSQTPQPVPVRTAAAPGPAVQQAATAPAATPRPTTPVQQPPRMAEAEQPMVGAPSRATRALTAREVMERQLAQAAPARVYRSALLSGAEASEIKTRADRRSGALLATVGDAADMSVRTP